MRLYLKIPTPTFEILAKLARTEMRHPREQAQWLICEALIARGLLAPPAPHGGPPEPPPAVPTRAPEPTDAGTY
jgi:hypothetical protein